MFFYYIVVVDVIRFLLMAYGTLKRPYQASATGFRLFTKRRSNDVASYICSCQFHVGLIADNITHCDSQSPCHFKTIITLLFRVFVVRLIATLARRESLSSSVFAALHCMPFHV